MKNEKYCIMVADDEQEIRDVLKLLLSGDGYEIVLAKTGKEVLEQNTQDIDLFILDVNMPELSGFMTAAKIREKCQTPIIFLTAYSAESDKVIGFSAGADDYIVKPFSNIELLMRVKAVLRRNQQVLSRSEEKNILEFQDLTLDLDSQSIMRNGEVIPLTYTEFKILELFVRHRKKIFSLDNIYQSIWGEEAIGDSAIMVHIKNIRKKLNDSSRNSKYIKTAWGRGYYAE